MTTKLPYLAHAKARQDNERVTTKVPNLAHAKARQDNDNQTALSCPRIGAARQ